MGRFELQDAATEVRQPGFTMDGAAPLDRFGRPLLTRAATDGATRYRFGGRFNPSDGDFVLRPEFPALMAHLWAAPLLSLHPGWRRDRRAFVASQLAPRHVRDGRGRSVPDSTLRELLFLLAGALLVIERALAYRRAR